MLKNIEQAKQNELASSDEFYKNLPDDAEVGSSNGKPVDVYKKKTKNALESSRKKYPNGSSAMMLSIAKSVLGGKGSMPGLSVSYRKALEDSDSLKRRGENDRADLVRQQYMEEKFLPAVEVVIAYSSPDEMLNNKSILSAFDKYVLGVGSSSGYTASYIRTSYGDVLGSDLKGTFNGSDDTVADRVIRIKQLCNSGQVRSAVGMARKIKKQIDDGEHIASDDDYALLGRVASYGS